MFGEGNLCVVMVVYLGVLVTDGWYVWSLPTRRLEEHSVPPSEEGEEVREGGGRREDLQGVRMELVEDVLGLFSFGGVADYLIGHVTFVECGRGNNPACGHCSLVFSSI